MTFYSYFFSYIFKSKTRQRLLLIAIISLALSSFSLLVVKSIMGGLQSGVVKRSKEFHGKHSFDLKDLTRTQVDHVQEALEGFNVEFVPEYELELLIKHDNYISPTLIHGFTDKMHPALKEKDLKGIVVGVDLGTKIQSHFSSKVDIISPVHTDPFFGDVPLSATDEVTDYISTDLPEVDIFHSYVRMNFLKNFIDGVHVNKIRILGVISEENLSYLKKNYPGILIESWESHNKSLVFALNLESTVMMFLFISMTLLVSISILSGYLIFYDKVKKDLLSFWILGLSKEYIFKMFFKFMNALSIISVSLGLLFGYGILLILESNSIDLMPAIFVERKLPVLLTFKTFAIAFIVPYLVSLLFAALSLKLFKKENSSFLKLIRSVG
jgi:lipoprotein-releasing system permease protein